MRNTFERPEGVLEEVLYYVGAVLLVGVIVAVWWLIDVVGDVPASPGSLGSGLKPLAWFFKTRRLRKVGADRQPEE